MDGIGGKAGTYFTFTTPFRREPLFILNTGWQWIFILEGLATVVISIASYWVIQDFPTTAKFLTEDERKPELSNENATVMTVLNRC
jgi:sugar phosphate permease